jgi:hypothetical protein
MKKIITLVISGFVTVSAFAQTKFFFEAGINSSVPAFQGRVHGGPSREPRTGFTASAGIVNKLGDGFQLSNRLSFITKNFHESFFVGPDYSGTIDYRLQGLQYHLLMEKDLTKKKKIHFIPAAGLYTTLHTGGDLNSLTSTFAGLVKESRDLSFDKNGDFNRWDAGLTICTRLQWKKIGLGVLYDIGLAKIDPGTKAKWSSVHFLITYSLR